MVIRKKKEWIATNSIKLRKAAEETLHKELEKQNRTKKKFKKNVHVTLDDPWLQHSGSLLRQLPQFTENS